MQRARLALAGIALASASATAQAGWSVFGEVEHFRWDESTSPRVTETGPRVALGAAWSAERPQGWQPAYRGRVYAGSVDYNGAFLFSGAPATGTTQYFGFANELQGIYRLRSAAELVFGVGWDYWERSLSADQRETYNVVFARVGANFDRRGASGWFAGAGLKYPIYGQVDPHLRSIGFDQNPTLELGRQFSLYAQVGHRFSRRWSLAAYYDSYHFKESSSALVTSGGSAFTVVQPESKADSVGLRLQYAF